MQRLSNLWTAPFPAYAPSFVKSARFGYFLSAMFAVGILLLLSLAMRYVVERRREASRF
jgi:cobalt/nickel transport system permease protein